MTDRRFRQRLPLGGEDGLPFSKGLMARSLIAAGLSADRAYELAIAIENDLTASERQSTTIERIEEVALEKLGREDGAAAMRRLRRYRDLYELDLPLILLVGVGDMGGNLLFAAASAQGLVSIVSVLASLYPIVTVLLARIVLGERVARSQEAGVALTLTGVALIAAG